MVAIYDSLCYIFNPKLPTNLGHRRWMYPCKCRYPKLPYWYLGPYMLALTLERLPLSLFPAHSKAWPLHHPTVISNWELPCLLFFFHGEQVHWGKWAETPKHICQANKPNVCHSAAGWNSNHLSPAKAEGPTPNLPSLVHKAVKIFSIQAYSQESRFGNWCKY